MPTRRWHKPVSGLVNWWWLCLGTRSQEFSLLGCGTHSLKNRITASSLFPLSCLCQEVGVSCFLWDGYAAGCGNWAIPTFNSPRSLRPPAHWPCNGERYPGGDFHLCFLRLVSPCVWLEFVHGYESGVHPLPAAPQGLKVCKRSYLYSFLTWGPTYCYVTRWLIVGCDICWHLHLVTSTALPQEILFCLLRGCLVFPPPFSAMLMFFQICRKCT